MIKAMNDNLGILTNISFWDIDDIRKRTDFDDNIKDNPMVAVDAKEVSGTDVMPVQFGIIDGFVLNMGDYIFSCFEDSDSKMADDFNLAKPVIATTGNSYESTSKEIAHIENAKILIKPVDFKTILSYI